MQLLEVNPSMNVVHSMPANISLGQQAINELVACCHCCCLKTHLFPPVSMCVYMLLFSILSFPI